MKRSAGFLAILLSAATTGRAVDCAPCHKQQAGTTQMSHALETVATCGILKQHRNLEFHDAVYSYSIVREGSASQYTVTDGKATISVPIGWAFGLGDAGQTYVYERNGKMYESRVSYYKELLGLGLTMGAQNRQPANLEEAAGRLMVSQEAGQCFNCHSTGAVHHEQLSLHTMTPGLQCVRCHEGGDAHALAVQRGDALAASAIPRLGKLSSEETSTFCGQCHRTWADIAANGPQGVNNVRFQPYRLTNSKCFDAADRRIACTSCHDPHQPLAVAANAYDAKCQNCHSGLAAAPKTCPVAKRDCAGCHMPKFELPGAHHQFTDHQIRIVRAGERYPN